MTDKPPTQLDKFKEAARLLKTDDDPERFKERIGKLEKPAMGNVENEEGRSTQGKPVQANQS